MPVSHALPAASRPTAFAPSLDAAADHRRKDQRRAGGIEPGTNASLPSGVVSKAPGVVGKSTDPAPPETYALPAASTTRPPPESNPLPPRNVE